MKAQAGAVAGGVTPEQELAFVRKQNPYDWDNVYGQPDEPTKPITSKPTAAHAQSEQVGKVSKKQFEEECRRILLPYIPAPEGRVLRPHHRDFITRNANLSPEHRFRIVKELLKYDISTSGSFKPHFNRERELFTVKKLRQIEKAAQAIAPST